METITITGNRTVSKQDYVEAKTKDLQNFGYPNLTEKEVSEQVDKVIKGEELSVIGMFIKDDIEI